MGKKKRNFVHFSNNKILREMFTSNLVLTIPNVLKLIGISLFILAPVRPQWGDEQVKTEQSGVDIVSVIDTSGSMKALDFEIDGERADRLFIVKNVLKEFIKQRKGDRVSLVTFGETAFTLSPLTSDLKSLDKVVDELQIGMAGESTALGNALGVAVKRLKSLEAKTKIVILLTDGRNNSGEVTPSEMASVAKELGIKVYTIGVGKKGGQAPFPINSFFGKKIVYQNVDLDDETLISIAKETNGKYFNATNTEELKNIYTQIDRLEKREVKSFSHVKYRDYYHYPLIFGLLILLIESFLRTIKWRVFP